MNQVQSAKTALTLTAASTIATAVAMAGTQGATVSVSPVSCVCDGAGRCGEGACAVAVIGCLLSRRAIRAGG